MRKYVIAAAVAGVLVVSMSTPAFGLPRSFVDDPDDFMNYRTTESTSNCGGNTACDIAWSSFVVSKSSPDSVVVLAGMTGRTDPEMSNSEKGGLYLFVDSDTDANDWEYVLWTRYQSYPLMEVVASWVYSWDGDSWEKTDVLGAWLRAETAWGATSPIRSWG